MVRTVDPKSISKDLWSLAHYVRSYIHLFSGDISNAINDCDAFIKIIVKQAKSGINQATFEFIDRLVRFYMHCGRIYHLRGSFVEAEYFYKKGLEISRRSNSSVYQLDSNIWLSEIEYQKDQLEKSKTFITEASDYLKTVN